MGKTFFHRDIMSKALKKILDEQVKKYNSIEFIEKDPISIPHLFTLKQDIEIAGFFAATIAWGNRTSILNSCKKMMEAMDYAPYDFLIHHEENDLKRFMGIKHRTFNETDLFYFIHFLQGHYQQHHTLEVAFNLSKENNMKDRLMAFHGYFFSIEHPHRTQKHVSTPIKNSACKRLNMYLRWMVRQDNNGVDFGLWKSIKPAELIMPMDVHVCNVAHHFGLIPENKSNWNMAKQLTNNLKKWDAKDPVKYDYALFSLGVNKLQL